MSLDYNSEQFPFQGQQDDHLVTLEQYGLQQPWTQQKLTPLDMNMPRVYGARYVLCFPLMSGIEKSRVYGNLRQGLAYTANSISWIAGTIAPEEGEDPKNRRIEIINSPGGVSFPCKDLTNILPSYAELKARNFPLSEFPTAKLGPIDVMPQGPDQPVFAAQANFIQDGLLLTIGVHHSACDASALDAIMNTWSHNTAAASGSSKSFSTFDGPSNDRKPHMQGMPGADLDNFPEYVLMPTPHADAQGMPTFQLPPLSSRLFHFSPETLTNLKATAAAFSTHDALCAFVWQRMTMARMRSGVFTDPASDAETSALGFAVNVRNRMSPPLPPTYLGNASMACLTEKLTVSTITSDSGLPRVAAAIRKSVGAFNSPNRVPLTIGLLNSRPDPTDFKLAYNAFLGPDIVATSWADLRVYENDWGTMGMLDALRIPGEGADGVITILPRLKDGSLEVVVALATAAMEMLLEDKVFIDVARS
ncbi:transferase [Fusarium oxysporum f. sp. albedinis]|nr:transferase [Fusarium oxysporum f. sp. albedinis]KAK2469883.1 hypothetical protein H9L39_18698 [Fusarium oxysporum f. sp. albedinis]